MQSGKRTQQTAPKAEAAPEQAKMSNLLPNPTVETAVQRKAMDSGSGLTPSRVLQMQRAYGNQAVMQMLRHRQPKPTPPIQRMEEEREDESEELQMKPAGPEVLQRSPAPVSAPSTTTDTSTATSAPTASSSSGGKGGSLLILVEIRNALQSYSGSGDRDATENPFDTPVKAATYSSLGATVLGGGAKKNAADAKAAGQQDAFGGEAKAVGAYSGTVGEALSAVKSVIEMAKSIYDLYKKYKDQEGLTKGEAARGTIETINHAVAAAQASLKTAKAIMEIMESSTASLATAIPGVGIAVSGVKIALKTVSLIQAQTSKTAMTKLKREFKTKYAKSSFITARKWYGNATGTDKKKLEDRKNELRTKIAMTRDAKAQEELDDIERYELAKEMKTINVKRMDRGILQVGVELTKIAGEIATLTGVGAQVGMPLKLVAAGVGGAMPLARKMKQAGRDRAANKDAWGITKAVFNADKSTTQKSIKRSMDAKLMLNMLKRLPDYNESDQAVVNQYTQVKSFVEATGISLQYLETFKGDPAKLKDGLREAMAKRE